MKSPKPFEIAYYNNIYMKGSKMTLNSISVKPSNWTRQNNKYVNTRRECRTVVGLMKRQQLRAWKLEEVWKLDIKPSWVSLKTYVLRNVEFSTSSVEAPHILILGVVKWNALLLELSKSDRVPLALERWHFMLKRLLWQVLWLDASGLFDRVPKMDTSKENLLQSVWLNITIVSRSLPCATTIEKKKSLCSGNLWRKTTMFVGWSMTAPATTPIVSF